MDLLADEGVTGAIVSAFSGEACEITLQTGRLSIDLDRDGTSDFDVVLEREESPAPIVASDVLLV